MTSLDHWMEMAKANIERDGDLVPVLHVECDGPPLLMAIEHMPPTSEMRSWLVGSIGAKLADRHPRKITMVMDAYIGAGPVEDSLADHPDTEECLVVASLTSTGEAQVLTARYERDPTLDGTHFTFRPTERHGDGAEMFLLRAFFEGCSGVR